MTAEKAKRRKEIWGFLDGDKPLDVEWLAMENSLTIGQVKKMLVQENPGDSIVEVFRDRYLVFAGGFLSGCFFVVLLFYYQSLRS
jgi:hypothetical protein